MFPTFWHYLLAFQIVYFLISWQRPFLIFYLPNRLKPSGRKRANKPHPGFVQSEALVAKRWALSSMSRICDSSICNSPVCTSTSIAPTAPMRPHDREDKMTGTRQKAFPSRHTSTGDSPDSKSATWFPMYTLTLRRASSAFTEICVANFNSRLKGPLSGKVTVSIVIDMALSSSKLKLLT